MNRLISEVNGQGKLKFEMSIPDGDGNDRLAFYVDGVKQAETTGESVIFERDFMRVA